MSIEPIVKNAFSAPRRAGLSIGVGWALVVIGAAWILAALWAVLFVLSEDRGGTELITAILNPLLPALLLPPGIAILRAGLLRTPSVDLQGWRHRLFGAQKPDTLA